MPRQSTAHFHLRLRNAIRLGVPAHSKSESMPRPIRLFDSIVILLAGRLLQASYRKFGYSPAGTQFALVTACYAVAGVAGCYLVSRWTLPDALTGFLFLAGAASTFRIASSISPTKRVWTEGMYEREAELALDRFRNRMFDRLFALFAFGACLGLLAGASANGKATEAVMMAGLCALALSSAIHGYLRAAPPPKPEGVSRRRVTGKG